MFKKKELGLLLQVLPVRIVTFVETLGSHLRRVSTLGLSLDVLQADLSVLNLQVKADGNGNSPTKAKGIRYLIKS